MNFKLDENIYMELWGHHDSGSSRELTARQRHKHKISSLSWGTVIIWSHRQLHNLEAPTFMAKFHVSPALSTDTCLPQAPCAQRTAASSRTSINTDSQRNRERNEVILIYSTH
jgi:hypothetical protein